MSSVYDFSAARINGQEAQLSDYRGEVLLVVNTASKCGFTPQLEGLEELHKKYSEQGLRILGFPCNQFGKQDPGSNDEIQEFCQLNYGVSFPMFAKIEVNGDDTHPLYQHLKAAAPGVLGTKKIKWNFTKFLIGRDGEVIERYGPATKPKALEDAIVSALAS